MNTLPPQTLGEGTRTIARMQALGHGSPRRCRLAAGGLLALSALTLIAGPARAAPASRATSEPTFRLRLTWGGGPPVAWQGSIAISDGEFSELTPLCLEPDTPGASWIESSAVRVAAPSPRTFDGVDVSLRAELDAVLTVQLSAEGAGAAAAPIEIRLADLMRDSQTHSLDSEGTRLSVRRAPGDALRVVPPPGGLVVAPGQAIALRVQPRWLDVEPRSKVRLEFEVRPARGAKSLWSTAREIDWPEVDEFQPDLTEEIRAPLAAGAYDIAITASTRSLRQRFGLRQTLTERQVQFVVVDPTPEVAGVDPRMTSFPQRPDYELDPTSYRWWEQIARLPGTQRWWRGPVGSGHAAVVEHRLGKVVELRARPHSTSAAQEPTWEAYPLTIREPGGWHRLDIEYPSDVSQHLGVYVIDGAGSGPLAPVAIDQGFTSVAESGESQWRTHRVVFWPRTKNPVVLLTNRLRGGSAWFGKLRVWEGGNPPPTPAPREGYRMRLAQADLPLLADSLGASYRADPISGQSITDWQTFHEAAERLAAHLRRQGYDGAALTVAGEGSALYPSAFLGPSPRYDTGVFSSAGHDPTRKDVLELLCRVFDRHGLKLVPIVRFSSPLPALEAAKREDTEPGVSLVSARGDAWLEGRRPHEGAAAWYNPLDPRVARAMTEVVGEVTARCREHACFAGVGVRIESAGFARLPGVDWAFDETTLERFARAANLEPQGLAGRQILSAHREAWVDWRAAQMTALFAQWGRDVSEARPGARLHLLGAGLYEPHELQMTLRPQLPWVSSSADAIREYGLDLAALRESPGVVVAASHRAESDIAPSPARVRLERDRARDLSTAAPRGGATFYWRSSRRQPLPSAELRAALRTESLTLLEHSGPDARLVRESFVRDLAQLDVTEFIEGGAGLSLVDSQEMQNLMSVYRRLPAAPFADVPGPGQPIVARQASYAGKTYLYLLNTAPWPTTAQVRFTVPAGVRATSLAGDLLVAPAMGPNVLWTPEIAGYDLIALEIETPTAEIRIEGAEFAVENLAQMDVRIRDLMARAANLQSVRRYEALPNASFEAAPTQSEPLPGWRVLSSAGGGARAEASAAHDGRLALRLQNPGGTLVVASAPAPTPETARLTLGAWIRVTRVEPGTQFRLAVRSMSGDYYRVAPVEIAGGVADWRWCAMRLDDLIDSGAPLELRFELHGGGELWIDDVRLFDLDFTQQEKIGLAQILHLADAQLRVHKVAECQQTLSSYWPAFLEQHVPPAQAAHQPVKGPVERQAARPEPPNPGMLDSLKRYVPRPLRWY